jgi:tetratricopeptide (TPR) repeat protein
MSSSKRVFLSCATAVHGALRRELDSTLRRARFEVRFQEVFRQEVVDTLDKLELEVRPCALVLHFIGENPGACPTEREVKAFLAARPGFLGARPDLVTRIGADFSGVTYTQWEALLALHYDIPMLVFQEGVDVPPKQAQHVERLVSVGRFPSAFRSTEDLYRQLIGDLEGRYPDPIDRITPIEREIATSRITRHAPRQLFGRDEWLDKLDEIWNEKPEINVFSIIAWGGVGKTSLVAKWMNQRLAAKGWPGVERYFDWTFYSQGSKESSQTSSDKFIQEALTFFGDPDPTSLDPRDRGERLAKQIRKHRTLLILDGIEPLQYPPESPMAGRLKDPALVALLETLAMSNEGLCVVTSRERLVDLDSFQGGTTDEEMEKAWEKLDGHALSLQLMGRFLADAHGGDMRQWDLCHFDEIEETRREHRSAFNMMATYENWLNGAGPDRQADLQALRLTGLFDRPASSTCLKELRKAPALPGLTDALVELTPTKWRLALKDLEKRGLITLNEEEDGVGLGIDAHPLIREYFARQLRTHQKEAFEQAHSRLFDYLCESTEHRPDTLEGLEPLYQAVTHGCLAGRHGEAGQKVYFERILRENASYSTKMLGAVGAALGAIAAFFDRPWDRVSANLHPSYHAWLLNEAAFFLRALGRLGEAMAPMRVGAEMLVAAEDRENAAIAYSNLSLLAVVLGRLPTARDDAQRSVDYADQSQVEFSRVVRRVALPEAYRLMGERDLALSLFDEAEQLQRKWQAQFPLLYGMQGFFYCQALLQPAEDFAWARIGGAVLADPEDVGTITVRVTLRAEQTLAWDTSAGWLVDMALEHLTLAQARLHSQLLKGASAADPASWRAERELNGHLREALSLGRRANYADHLPRFLLTDAWYQFLCGHSDAAEERLAEAQRISERGPMPLFLADVHLTRGRLFKLKESVKLARGLIDKHGYGCRRRQLEDAELAAENW